MLGKKYVRFDRDFVFFTHLLPLIRQLRRRDYLRIGASAAEVAGKIMAPAALPLNSAAIPLISGKIPLLGGKIPLFGSVAEFRPNPNRINHL
jgi:hypothetical protein